VLRLLACIVAVVGTLSIVVSSSAATSGPATGQIYFELGTIGCALAATTSDGTQVFAFGPAGGSDRSTQFLGGTSFADPHVGFICTGTADFTGLPPNTSLVLTGLTCSVVRGAPPNPDIPYGDLATPGTAIFYSDGTVRLICPPSTRTE
jgi:hypothetical protein